MEKLIGFLTIIGSLLLVCVVISLPVMWLWNWLMPVIFGLVEIGFWQALGLSALCGLLFKSTSSK